MAKGFLTDVETIRKRARQHIEQGAVRRGRQADLAGLISTLDPTKQG